MVDQPGIFRYRQFLPVGDDVAPVSRGEGRTPLLRLDNVASRLGVQRLYLKDESQNPTWSYKDRLAAVAVTKARELGAQTIVVSSTGNHGAAAAAYGATAGIECVALTIVTVPETMKVLMQSFGATVAACRTGPDRWTLMAQGVAERGWIPMSGFHDPPSGSNPFGVDGYKTIAYELVKDLGTAPDVVVVPTAYGDGLIGIQRGFEDLRSTGRTSRVPRLMAAEPLGSYARALENGLETPVPVPFAMSVAFSTATPIGTYQGLEALRRSSGGAVELRDDEEIMQMQLLAARTEGLYAEAASALGLAAVPRLVANGVIADDELVVVIGSSTGLKDVGETANHLAQVPVVDPDLASLDTVLAPTT